MPSVAAQLKLHAAAAVGAAAAAAVATTKGRLLPSLLVGTAGATVQPPLLGGNSASGAAGAAGAAGEEDGDGSGSPSGIIDVVSLTSPQQAAIEA